MTKKIYDSIIIGAGPAGLSAAIYARRAGLGVLVFDREVWGGKTVNTSEIANYPTILNISGPEFAMKLYEHALGLGAEINIESVLEVTLGDKEKRIKTDQGEYFAKTVIIANGVARRNLEVPGEQKYTGRGVSYCATCDGVFFKDKEIFIVGGGNSALEEALFLANSCSKVSMLHRNDSFKGDQILVDRVMANPKIEVVFNAQVKEIIGTDKVEEIRVLHIDTGEEKLYKKDGIFVAIGYAPENQIFAEQLEIADPGYIVADENCTTNLPGVFACGDTRTKELRQIVTAASDGAMGGFRAAQYILLES